MDADSIEDVTFLLPSLLEGEGAGVRGNGIRSVGGICTSSSNL